MTMNTPIPSNPAPMEQSLTTTSTTLLFVGDLSSFCTEADLSSIFHEYGPVLSAQVRKGRSGDSLMHGFVELQDPSQAQKAVENLNDTKFMGRRMRVNWANSTLPPREKDSWIQLHVSFVTRELNYVVTEATLDSIFGAFGEIADICLKRHVRDHDTLVQSGYGFIYFFQAESAVAASQAIRKRLINGVTYDCSISYRSEQDLKGKSSSNSISEKKNEIGDGTNKTDGNCSNNSSPSSSSPSYTYPYPTQQQFQPMFYPMFVSPNPFPTSLPATNSNNTSPTNNNNNHSSTNHHTIPVPPPIFSSPTMFPVSFPQHHTTQPQQMQPTVQHQPQQTHFHKYQQPLPIVQPLSSRMSPVLLPQPIHTQLTPNTAIPQNSSGISPLFISGSPSSQMQLQMHAQYQHQHQQQAYMIPVQPYQPLSSSPPAFDSFIPGSINNSNNNNGSNHGITMVQSYMVPVPTQIQTSYSQNNSFYNHTPNMNNTSQNYINRNLSSSSDSRVSATPVPPQLLTPTHQQSSNVQNGVNNNMGFVTYFTVQPSQHQ